jgi:dTDP-4-amino-4,6-dideoxygalactose transaminase
MIPFNKPPYTGKEDEYVLAAMRSPSICGDGFYSKKCEKWFEQHFSVGKALFTPSCTHALEMAAILLDIQAGDEVIMPSFTFVSTANAFVLRGAKIKFVDIRPDTMNMDESKIEPAITAKTKAIVVVHYAGISCDMDIVMAIAEKYKLKVVEDAAQGVMSTYKGRHLGAIGHIAAYSFHETKNYTSGGEGGMLLINDAELVHRAEIIREKGTNRSQFFRGMVDKYSWVDIGSSYLPSELQCAYLWAQLEQAAEINQERLGIWTRYFTGLQELAAQGKLVLPVIPSQVSHNAHMFYVKLTDIDQRTDFLKFLRSRDILAVFHYIPLHSSKAGLLYSEFVGEDLYTTSESERLVRLPVFYGLTIELQNQIIQAIHDFFDV